MIHDNKLSGGQPRALLGLNDSARQAEIAEKIIEKRNERQGNGKPRKNAE